MAYPTCLVTGNFYTPEVVSGVPIATDGKVYFVPSVDVIMTPDGTVVGNAHVTGELRNGVLYRTGGSEPGVTLVAPGDGVEPSEFTYTVHFDLQHNGEPVHKPPFAFTPIEGEVDLTTVTPVPVGKGLYYLRGEKGDTPTEEDIRPVVESILPSAVEEAVRPLAPSVADSYPPHGDITLEDGKTLHILSLDGEARIAFPASGSPGHSFILAIVRGAEHAIIPGREKLASANSPRSLWLSVVHDGTRWLPAPGQDSSQAGMFDEAIGSWRERFPNGTIDQQNILEAIVEAAAWVRAFTAELVSLSDEMDLGQLDASLAGESTDRALEGDSAARYLYGQYYALVGVVQNMRTTTGFFEWMARNLTFGHREDVSYSFPPNGHSAILHSDDQSAALVLGDAYEVVGLEEGSPRLRVRIRPYADESYGEYRQGAYELTPHKHAGEVYEVPLVRVEEA